MKKEQHTNGQFLILLITAVFAFLSPALFAGTTGKIAGIVLDAQSKEPIVGANIYLENQMLGASSDASGYYSIINIPPGTYTVIAQVVGYSDVKMQNVRVLADKTTNINFELNERAIQSDDEIIIVAERAALQKDLTSTNYTVTSDQIKFMPVENLKDVLTLKAGIVEDAAGNLHFRGGRSSEVSYLVDGIPINNVTSGEPMMIIEKDFLNQLEVITGTFNAEYGQALSGIVNAITRDGSESLDINAEAYLGDYYSNHTTIFPTLSEFKPGHIQNIQLGISFPINLFGQKLYTSFFARNLLNDGWIYGLRRFQPQDSSNFANPAKIYIEESGDSSYVPMNPDLKRTFSSKLVYKVSPSLKLSYSFFYNTHDFQRYNHLFKQNPDGRLKNFENSFTHLFKVNHALTSNIFYDISLALLIYDFKSYVFENPHDPRYQSNEKLFAKGSSFLTGGTEMSHTYRKNQTLIAKGDISFQMNSFNLFKSGFELKYHTLDFEEFIIQKGANTQYKSVIPGIESPFHNQYRHNPIEAAIYLQDKIEWGDLIVNAGLRYDYFDSNGRIPLDPRDPNNRIKKLPGYRFKKASPKQQLSPRIGLSYPMSTTSILRASYGHFFQIPPFDYLYVNPEFEIIPNSLSTRVGNADFEPQTTTTFEIGLQQALTDGWVFDLTGFVKDIRNLTGQEIVELYILGDRYARYINRDFGSVRGITLSFNKAYSDYWALTFDYTYQIAEGNASDPDQVFRANQSTPPAAVEKQLAPLNWDQRHTINFSVSLGNLQEWGINLIGRFGSGMPYTPQQSDERSSIENSARKPPTYTMDVRMFYTLNFLGLRSQLFLNIYNVTDQLNELAVYTDTGRAGYNLTSLHAGGARFVNSIQEYVIRPDFYSEPRRIQFGISFNFSNN